MSESLAELYAFEVPSPIPLNLMIAFDSSGSMDYPGGAPFAAVKNSIVKILGRVERDMVGRVPVRILLCSWQSAAEPATTETWENVTRTTIREMTEWVYDRTVATIGGTDYVSGLSPGLAFFPTDGSPANNVLIFISDGVHTEDSFDEHAVQALIQRTDGYNVDIFAALVRSDLTPPAPSTEPIESLGLVDNTPQDDVPEFDYRSFGASGGEDALANYVLQTISEYTLSGQYYTSADHEIEYDEQAYTPIPIGRSAPESGQDPLRCDMNITVARSSDLFSMVVSAPEAKPISVTILQQAQEDGEEESETSVFWKGRVKSYSLTNSTLTLGCESLYASMRRRGLRAVYQTACRHALYSRECGADRESLAVTTTYQSIQQRGRVYYVNITTQPANTFAGGLLVAPDGSETYIQSDQFVEPISGTPYVKIVLAKRVPWLESEGVIDETLVKLYPGCNHTHSDCVEIFNNGPSFGGFKLMPKKNPFQKGIL